MKVWNLEDDFPLPAIWGDFQVSRYMLIWPTGVAFITKMDLNFVFWNFNQGYTLYTPSCEISIPRLWQLAAPWKKFVEAAPSPGPSMLSDNGTARKGCKFGVLEMGGHRLQKRSFHTRHHDTGPTFFIFGVSKSLNHLHCRAAFSSSNFFYPFLQIHCAKPRTTHQHEC